MTTVKKILVLIALLVALVLAGLKLIAPLFANLFIGLGAELPLPTSLVSHYPLLAADALIVLLAGLLYLRYRKARKQRRS